MNKRVMPRLRRRLKLWLGEKLAFTQDISPSGLAVEVMAALPPGSMVHGRLEVDGQCLPFTGTVAWMKRPEPRLQQRGEAGVRLTGIDAAFYGLFSRLG